MTAVYIDQVNVEIPVYDSSSLRLLRLPSFSNSKVGTRSVSMTSGTIVMHALKNISLNLVDGDRVCLIGHNGSGKTSLLRLVAGIYPASSGTVRISGNIFALLGGSFSLNADATGYENINLIANLFDWPQEHLASHIKDIEDFTELGTYLSLPTRIYSAGMHSRLSFALATAQSPDILLMDEGIGAGDAQFQKKAQVRIQNFVSRARIIMLASHSVDLCRAMCNKALVLSNGEAVFYGDLEEGLKIYLDTI